MDDLKLMKTRHCDTAKIKSEEIKENILLDDKITNIELNSYLEFIDICEELKYIRRREEVRRSSDSKKAQEFKEIKESL